MDHSVPLITTIAAAFGLALVLGFIAARLKLPALVGYLLAGVLIGPATPGFVADVGIAAELAEIGVMLLMFGVGLHFSLDDLLAVRSIALPGAVVQMAVATAMGTAAGIAWGWPWAGAVVFGLALSVASTVVLLRALESRGVLESVNGRIAVGWLVVEDLAMVLVLVLLPPLAGLLGAGTGGTVGSGQLWIALGRTLLAVTAFIALMLVVGRRVFPWLLWQVTRTGSRELFTLCVVAAAVGIAYGSAQLFGVSFALGAFFAGMVLRESEFSHRAAEETLPLRDAFAVLFFVSVGMLFDPAVVLDDPLRVLVVVAIIVFGKSLAAAALVLLLRYPLNTALTVSASLAQIGEFSFILAGLGVTLQLLPERGAGPHPRRRADLHRAQPARVLGHRAAAALAARALAARARARAARRPAGRAADVHRPQVPREPGGARGPWPGRPAHRAGAARARRAVHRGRPEPRARGAAARAGPRGRVRQRCRAGDAGAGARRRARMLVIATPETLQVRRMVETARALNPDIEVVVRSHNEDEAALLEGEHAGKVFVGESELARSMTEHVLARVTHA